MHTNKKTYTMAVMVFIAVSMVLSSVTTTQATGAITLTPTAQASGSSITVSGTDFGANQAVGIGLGEEVRVINETMNIAGPYDVANGPYIGFTSHFPIKPGSFSMSINVSSTAFVAVSPDLGNGTLGDPTSIFINGTMNYVTGQYTRFSKTIVPLASNFVHLVNYSYYRYDVTPIAGVITSDSGAFTASITVPSVTNGTYTVTAIDTAGKISTSILTVYSVIPEGLSFGVMVLLSTIAVVSASYLNKKRLRPR